MLNWNQPFSFFYQGAGKFCLYSHPLEATVYYQHKKVDVKTGKVFVSSLHEIETQLKKIQIKKNYKNTIFHFFYEWGMVQKGMSVHPDLPLLIVLRYAQKTSDIVLSQIENSLIVELEKSLNLKRYQNAFNEVYQNLIDGNCYQVNLTAQFKFKINSLKSMLNIFADQDSISAFAHGTWLPLMERLYLSNSPECLFKITKTKILSYPIKGTCSSDLKALKALLHSKKNQAELYMITDLMTNDLASLGFMPVKVEKKKAVLKVPQLFHTYSKISAPILKNCSYFEIMNKLFPGGSITGAPKKRVMQIIQKVEHSGRGFYTGSTLLLDGSIKTASINIRSATVDSQKLQFTYGAGGGITLRSQAKDEYEEMLKKLNSFIGLTK
jgi:para-aminobenzoate synthetase component 1